MRLASLVILLGFPVLAPAQTTWYVDIANCPGPGSGSSQDPFCHIQDAIDAARDGDSVLVLPGRYEGAIDFIGKAILVRSDLDGDPATCDPAPELTLIDSDAFASAVTFANGEEQDSVLQGFTLQYANADLGGGIYCADASPRIIGNIIDRNYAQWGGGIYCRGGAPFIASNIITLNGATSGGGIYCREGCRATITNNTIYENHAYAKGGGIACLLDCRIQVRNTILWNNVAYCGPAITIAGGTAWLQIAFSDIEGGAASINVESGGELDFGEGNIDAAPLVEDPWDWDLHLSADSPCVNAGGRGSQSGELPDLDIDAEPRVSTGIVDMGADELWSSAPSRQPGVQGLQTVWYVDDDNLPGPGTGRPSDPFLRIQDAIEAARDGETVLVLPGLYAEALDFRGKALTVRSDGDGDPSTHDLSTDARVEGNDQIEILVLFTSAAEGDSVLEGFTIANAHRYGIWCEGHSLTIRHNIIRGHYVGVYVSSGSAVTITANSFSDNSSGVAAHSSTIVGNTFFENTYGVSASSSTVVGNHFEGNGQAVSTSGGKVLRNTVINGGAAIYAYDGALVIDNIVYGNSSTGVYCDDATLIGNVISRNEDTYYYRGGGINVSGRSLLEDNLIMNNSSYDGGGILVAIGSTAVIRRNRILHNTADHSGGGICVQDRGNLLIDGNAVTGNSARSGGGIACQVGSQATVQGNIIAENNSATFGGGIFCQRTSSLSIRQNEFRSNQAGNHGGAIAIMSRGVRMIEENLFTGNEAATEGGAISCYDTRELVIRANRFRENVAGRGGAVRLAHGNAALELNEFSLNEAEEGGAIYAKQVSDLGVAGNVFLANHAAFGGGVHAEKSVLTLRNNTFTGNTAASGGGALACFNGSHATLTGEILWKDVAAAGGEIYVGAEPDCGTVAVSYSDLDLDQVFVHPGCKLDLGPGMIEADPLFIDADRGDVGLLPKSECIDAADPSDSACDAL
ncbi:MAG: right-handed parallel beta-helix repeat-containing protein, partial [Planctomycetota bacterium]